MQQWHIEFRIQCRHMKQCILSQSVNQIKHTLQQNNRLAAEKTKKRAIEAENQIFKPQIIHFPQQKINKSIKTNKRVKQRYPLALPPFFSPPKQKNENKHSIGNSKPNPKSFTALTTYNQTKENENRQTSFKKFPKPKP